VAQDVDGIECTLSALKRARDLVSQFYSYKIKEKLDAVQRRVNNKSYTCCDTGC